MDVKVELWLNHGYLFDPPHICTRPLREGRDGRGDEQRGVLFGSSPQVNVGLGVVGGGGRGIGEIVHGINYSPVFTWPLPLCVYVWK